MVAYVALDITFAVLAAAAVALFGAWSVREKQGMHLLLLLFTAIVSTILLAIAYPAMLTSAILPTVLGGVAVLSAMLTVLYSRQRLAFLAVILLICGAAFVTRTYIYATIGMFGVGTTIGMVYKDKFWNKKSEDKSMRRTRTEVRRDFLQILMGIAVLVPILLLPHYYRYAIFAMIIFGYALINYISGQSGRLRSRTGVFERDGVNYGTGAIHLAAGIALMLGFASTLSFAVFGIAALIFGDAAATIVGMHFYRSRRIPHNRRKSYAGTIAFFIVSAAFGIVALGISGVLMAVVLAVVESIDMPVDDNVAIPIATLLMNALILAI